MPIFENWQVLVRGVGISPPSRFVLLLGVQNLCLLSPLQANFIEDIILLFSDLIYLFQSYRNGDDFRMSKNRTERLQLRLSSEEKEAIAQKAADANMSIADYEAIAQKAADANMSIADYIVALSANQKIIDAKIIAQLILEIRRIGVNVNQVAAVANYQKFANKEMLSKVNDGQNQIIDLLMKILSEVYDTEKHDIRSLENQMAKLTEAIEGMMKSGNSQSN